ncbi:protein kinase [Streptomyces sp. NBC_01216]|uniref:serine/threonine-protein kinase n=1 Tax=Streptomyces sp. NBC_01216 TaxID=2903778 RepID=UPI002E11C4C6|nr:protein kinase [Streptomyces sp. NBC_01216]
MSRVIDGRFELVERLGGGGMGTVWRARDLALHREVALKEVRPPDPAMAEYEPEAARTLRERVLREARALARLDHPNVVTIHHIVDGGEGTYPWLVMELVTGGSLHDRLERGTMTPSEAARLGRDLLSALRAAHERGIEHRDVKPANVLLRPDGRPVLTDFGIAAVRESTNLTATGSVIGSPDYMAPERVRGGVGGAAGDLWSLGMLLYVAVEGRHPLRRATTLATLAAVLSEDVPPPRQAGPLGTVLAALLVRDPAARPRAEELDRALSAVAESVAPTGHGIRKDATATPADPRTGGVTGQADGRGAPGAPAPVATSFPLAPPVPGQAPGALSGPAVTPPPPPFPAGGTTPPPFAAGATTTAVPGGRRRTGARLGFVLAVLLAVALPVGYLNRDGWKDSGDTGARGPSAAASSPSSLAPAPDAPADTADDRTAKTDLLTAEGVKDAVAKLKPVMGGTKVTRFVVYPEYVIAEALVEGSTKRYDSFSYRGGDVAVREGSGGTVMTGTVPADLAEFDWDALPELLERAEKELGVENPTSRYLVVNPPSTVFKTGAGMSVYLSDDYGSGYLKADPKGKVIAGYPQER